MAGGVFYYILDLTVLYLCTYFGFGRSYIPDRATVYLLLGYLPSFVTLYHNNSNGLVNQLSGNLPPGSWYSPLMFSFLSRLHVLLNVLIVN